MDKGYLKHVQIGEDMSIKEAMRQMDSTAFKILFVVDKHDRFLGTVTDGDFRRWILSQGSLEDAVVRVCNKSSIVFSSDKYDISTVEKILIENRIEAVPLVDENRYIVDVLFWEDLFGGDFVKQKRKLNVPVAIMAGGMGTRFSTVTKILPKPLIPFGEKPIVEVIMDNFADFGCKNFYLLLGYKAAMIQSYFENSTSGYFPVYKLESEPGGTAGALRLLDGESLGEVFFVSNCDIIIKADYADIYDFHVANRHDITVVTAMRHFVIPYGVMETTTGGSLKVITEKPEYDFLVNTGMYVVNREVLSLIPKKDKFHFTDLLKKAQKNNRKVGVYPVSEKSWFDIGQPELWETSTSDFYNSFTKGKERE